MLVTFVVGPVFLPAINLDMMKLGFFLGRRGEGRSFSVHVRLRISCSYISRSFCRNNCWQSVIAMRHECDGHYSVIQDMNRTANMKGT